MACWSRSIGHPGGKREIIKSQSTRLVQEVGSKPDRRQRWGNGGWEESSETENWRERRKQIRARSRFITPAGPLFTLITPFISPLRKAKINPHQRPPEPPSASDTITLNWGHRVSSLINPSGSEISARLGHLLKTGAAATPTHTPNLSR